MKQAISSCLLALLLLGPLPTRGQGKSNRPTPGEQTARDPQRKSVSQQTEQDPSQRLLRQVSPSVLNLEFSSSSGEGEATGRVIRASAVAVGPGQVVTVISPTNWAVSLAAKGGPGSLIARQGSRTWPAAISHVDPERGLCWLRVEGLDAPRPVLRSPRTIKEGERVYFVGAQKDPENLTILEGSVSRIIPFKRAFVLQTNLDIWIDSQGGGVFDAAGRLVGIAAWFAMEGRKWAFALPTEWILPREGQIVSSPSARDYEVAQWHAVVWNEIGVSFVVAGDHASAARAYQNATDCDPSNALLWGLLGSARSLTREFESAIAAFNEAVRLNPSLSSAWSGLGDAYAATGQDVKAIEAYETAAKHEPKDFRIWGKMAVAYERLGQGDRALLAHEQANQLETDRSNDQAPLLAKIVEVNPSNAEAWHELGQAHARMKRFREAVRAYRESVRLSPLNDAAWFQLGYAYGQLKEYSMAAEVYEHSVRLKPTPDSWFALGSAYRDLKQWQKAADAFRESLRLNPEGVSSWFFLGETYCKQGDAQGLIKVHDQLRTLSPSTADVFFREIIQKSSSRCSDERKKSP